MPEEPSPPTPNPEPHFSQLTLHLTTPMPLSAPVRPDQVYLLGHLVLAMGSVLFGIATVRAKVLARKTAMMFDVRGAAVLLPFFGALIFAIPFTWLGYTLWSGKGEPVRQPQRVR